MAEADEQAKVFVRRQMGLKSTEFVEPTLMRCEMIKAVFRDGVIYPLEPVPPEWPDGQELRVEEIRRPDERERTRQADLQAWYREMQEVTAELNDPEEWEQLEATLAEADEQAKEFVRRQMGLS